MYWTRFLQLWVRIRNPVNRLRWPGTVVILHVLGDDTTDVIDAEEEEVVECFLSKCPDEAFDVR